MEDDELLRIPPEVFTPLQLFVCTYTAKIGNLKMNFVEMFHQIVPTGVVKALNCNHGHKCQPGFEKFLKLKRKPDPPHVKPRKLQGDGTCFNSAVEAIIILDPAVRGYSEQQKFYPIKCFASTGSLQVTGIIQSDLADGGIVVRAWVDYLNGFGLGADAAAPLTISQESPSMLNYKCAIPRRSDRVLLVLREISETLRGLPEIEDLDVFKGSSKKPIGKLKSAGKNTGVKYSWGDDIKVAVSYRASSKKLIKVNVFQRGSVNILGSDSYQSACEIHAFLVRTFRENWGTFIGLRPLKDSELRALKKGRAAAAPARLEITDDDLPPFLRGERGGGAPAPAPPAAPPPSAPEDPEGFVDELLRVLKSKGSGHRDEKRGRRGSDYLDADEVVDENEEDHEEDPLYHDPEVRDGSPLESPRKPV